MLREVSKVGDVRLDGDTFAKIFWARLKDSKVLARAGVGDQP